MTLLPLPAEQSRNARMVESVPDCTGGWGTCHAALSLLGAVCRECGVPPRVGRRVGARHLCGCDPSGDEPVPAGHLAGAGDLCGCGPAGDELQPAGHLAGAGDRFSCGPAPRTGLVMMMRMVVSCI
jgi:hypothetical protein